MAQEPRLGPSEELALNEALLRLNGRAWGIAVGLLFGGGLFLATNILVLKGGENVPATTAGNIRVGVLFLRHLLREFRGDERLALAAYYQGAKAVRERGLFDETITYVEAIRSLATFT